MSIRIALLDDVCESIRTDFGSNLTHLSRYLERISDCTVQLFHNGSIDPDEPTSSGEEARSATACGSVRSRFPVVRDEQQSNELEFVWKLRHSNRFDENEFDVVIHSGYPYVNWFVQKVKKRSPNLISVFWDQGRIPQAHSSNGTFQCDGFSAMIPNEGTSQQPIPSVVIPPGVDSDLFRPAEGERRRILGFEPTPEQSVVLVVERTTCPEAVIASIDGVARCENVVLLILASGSREQLRSYAETHMPNRYRILEPSGYESLPQLYQSSDLFLRLNEDKYFDPSYLQAASCGLPIVSAEGSVARRIFGNDACYVGSRNADEIADAICLALEPATRDLLANRVRGRILASWTWQQQAHKMREFVYSLTSIQTKPTEEKVSQAVSSTTFSLVNGGYSDSASIEN